MVWITLPDFVFDLWNTIHRYHNPRILSELSRPLVLINLIFLLPRARGLHGADGAPARQQRDNRGHRPGPYSLSLSPPPPPTNTGKSPQADGDRNLPVRAALRDLMRSRRRSPRSIEFSEPPPRWGSCRQCGVTSIPRPGWTTPSHSESLRVILDLAATQRRCPEGPTVTASESVTSPSHWRRARRARLARRQSRRPGPSPPGALLQTNLNPGFPSPIYRRRIRTLPG